MDMRHSCPVRLDRLTIQSFDPPARPQLPKRALVTGGNGFVGRKVVEMLLEQGCAVTVFDIAQAQQDAKVKCLVGNLVSKVSTAWLSVVPMDGSIFPELPIRIYHQVLTTHTNALTHTLGGRRMSPRRWRASTSSTTWRRPMHRNPRRYRQGKN